MVSKKRHSNAEIGAKLQQAGTLAREGKTTSHIARALGISVMTLHRWKKARPQPMAAASNGRGARSLKSKPDQAARIAELQSENTRLRQLVTDFLLEKVTMEERLGSRSRHRP
jgi:putative transposase